METFSFKSRDLSRLKVEPLEAQLVSDASDALSYHGQTLNIRRRALNPDGDLVQVQVQRVRLVYEGGDLKPGDPVVWIERVNVVQRKVQGVEVLLQ